MTGIENILSGNFTNNPTISKILDISAEKAVLEKSIDGATAPRYIDSAELQESGNSDLYNQTTTHYLVMCEAYKLTHTSTSTKFNQEGHAIDELMEAAIQQFKLDYIDAQNGFNIISKNEACNKLQKIEGILNTQGSEGYIFGGIDARTKPCPIDLTNITNIDSAGNILNNYTNATANVKTIAIAKNQSVKIGTDSSHPAFSSLIGAINKLTAANIVNPPVDLVPHQNNIQDALLKLESLKSINIDNKTELKTAIINNDETPKEATDTLNSSTFLKSADEVIQGLLDLTKSSRILELVKSLDYKDFQNLINSFR